MKHSNSFVNTIMVICFLLVGFIFFLLSAKSCNEPKPPAPPTVEKTILDTLRAAFTRMEQRDAYLQQKVDSLTTIVKTITVKQQQAKQGASTAIAQYTAAKEKKDTAAALTACDTLKKEHLAYVEYTEKKDAEVATIIATKDEQLDNSKAETDNVKLQNVVLETSNKAKDQTIKTQGDDLKKQTKKANRNGNWAKVFAGTTVIAIIISIVQILSPI
jgi:hypothetical protein